MSLDLSAYFTDPEGDSLTFTPLDSSNDMIATAIGRPCRRR